VLSQEAGHWIIERPDGSPEKLPLAWAEALPPIIASANCAGVVSADNPEAEPEAPCGWAGVTELLNLVKMIARLRAQPPEEVDDESQFWDVGTSRGSAGEQNPGTYAGAGVGTISAGETERIGASASRDAGQAGTGTVGEA